MKIKYWKLFPVEYNMDDKNRIATAAILSCSFCHSIIDGMDGPRQNVMCIKCYDAAINQGSGGIG